jgi:hypothetical protein
MLKTITYSVTLPATAEKLYDMYLSPKYHGAVHAPFKVVGIVGWKIRRHLSRDPSTRELRFPS